MVYARQLPLWKAVMDLAVHLGQAVRCFPRCHQYPQGIDLRRCAQRLCRVVTHAATAPRAFVSTPSSPTP